MNESREQLVSLEQAAPIEIPTAYRLAHLGIDTSNVYPKLTAQGVADALGVDSNAVRRDLAGKYHDIEPEELLSEHNVDYFDHYPHYMVELIREERAWRDWYYTLPSRLSTHKVAESVGRSWGWTKKTLEELYPNTPQQKKGHKSRFYSKVAVKQLRDMTLATAPDENWPTIPTLEKLTGRSREWVLNRLAVTTIRPEQRRQVSTGRVFPHYPPDSIEVLEEAMEQRPQPAGNWLTASGIEVATGRSAAWVNKRLEEKYIATGEPRLDDMSNERIHYPPPTIAALIEESIKQGEYEPAGDWSNRRELRDEIGLHGVTLARVMTQIEVEAELRLDKKGIPRIHYSPETKQQLAAKALELYGFPEANGWVTFTVAMKIIGRPARWIDEEFAKRGAVPETRLDKSRHAVDHYDPEIVQAIKEYGDTLDAGTMVSTFDILERTGKSSSWLNPRLKALGIQPVFKFSKRNRWVGHYPESIIDSLLNMD
jgi:hypothetical protein